MHSFLCLLWLSHFGRLNYCGLLILDTSLETFPSEDSVVKRLTSTSAGKRRFDRRRRESKTFFVFHEKMLALSGLLVILRGLGTFLSEKPSRSVVEETLMGQPENERYEKLPGNSCAG